MIIIQMSGGLGNQMFQYALFLKLRALGRDVRMDDVTEYGDRTAPDGQLVKARPLGLGIFGISYPRAGQEDIIRLRDADMHLSSRIRRKLSGRKSREIHDSDFVFDPAFLEKEEGYYCGCFQSARYFEGAEDAVLRAFTFPEQLPGMGDTARQVEEKIRAAAQPAALHLRFGDYLDKQEVYGGICTGAYYASALKYLYQKVPEATVFVFSNDAERAAAWIARQEEPQRFTLVTGSDEEHGYIDLYLMSLCRHFVIANSSFSWWGAWLGTHREKPQDPGVQQMDGIPQETGTQQAPQISGRGTKPVVIAPSFWINQSDGSQLRRRDIYTSDMVRINPEGELAALPDQEADQDTIFRQWGDKPAVSVIVAAYNIEAYIGRAIRSLAGQTMKNLQMIVVDDGSTDRTGAICDEFAAKIPGMQVIHKANGGLSDARNAGLAAAEGRFIGYLDGDDWAAPHMYETMLRGCLESSAQIAVAGYEEVEDVLGTDGQAVLPGDGMELAGEAAGTAATDGAGEASGMAGCVDEALLRSVLLDRTQAVEAFACTGSSEGSTSTPIPNAVWCKLFRRDIADDLLFPTGRNSEDIVYTTKALCRARRCCYIPSALYHYVNNRAGSIMNQKLVERRTRDELPFWQEHMRILRENDFEKQAEQAEFFYYRRLLYYEDDTRHNPDLAESAKIFEKMVTDSRKRALTLAGKTDCARTGDRLRVAMFALSPGLYHAFADMYEKTVVRFRQRLAKMHQ